MKTIRIGNGAGFWGDNLDAPRRLVEAGQLDYLTLEYLAELTMSILAHQKTRDPAAGYVTDFPTVFAEITPLLAANPQLKIVTNAGGMNPTGCAVRAAEILQTAGLNDMPVAAVAGDDLIDRIDELSAAGEEFVHLETGQPLTEIRDSIVSANAYLGAAGIVEALSQGARVVVSGRVADASLTVGPALHEFGWNADDWDRLAAATLAGHLIECGAQVCGGMYADWTPEIPLADVGYPIALMSDDGSVTITKPLGTGGTVTTGTVAEQLVYEIGDPVHYLTPDVDADFSQVRLEQEADDRVTVSGAAGRPAPERLKVSIAYADGYRASSTLVVCGGDAEAKARNCAEMIFARLRHAGCEPERTNVECLGAGDVLPDVLARPEFVPEVVLRVSVHDRSRETVERFTREFAPLVTSGPPGVTGYTGGRSRPQRVLAYWPTSIDRAAVSPTVTVKTAGEWIA